MALDETKLNEFIGKFVGDLGATIAAGGTVIGHKLGLYKALASGPATAGQLAARTDTNPRYTAEWLRGQAAGGYVEYDPASDSYSLTEEQAFVLTNPDGAVYAPGAFVLALGVLKASDRVIGNFRTGDGMGWHGVADRVAFEVAPAAGFSGTGYDFISTFDCLHDMGDPLSAAKHIRSAIADDGTWMVVEPAAADDVAGNLNPVGRVYYNFSAQLCIPNALSQTGGYALGAQAGEAAIRRIATDAGFTRFRRATETPFNIVYEVRP